jgi:hypothetical protein
MPGELLIGWRSLSSIVATVTSDGARFSFNITNGILRIVDDLPSSGEPEGRLRMSKTDQSFKSNSTTALRGAFIAVVIMFVATPLFAQNSSTYTEYAAKYVCGVPSANTITTEAIAKADYYTTINIHNPNLFTTDKPIVFLKKAVLAQPEGATKVPPSAFHQDSLQNDYAEQITCATIRSLLGSAAPTAPAFIEGFVVIVVPPASSPNQLDVVGVYTSSNNPPTALQVVPIAPRIITPPPAGAAFEPDLQ